MSLIPKAIELAFRLNAAQRCGDGTPGMEGVLRVWERFRRHRPIGELSLARYEELGCAALLHNAIRQQLIREEQLEPEFGRWVASAVARAADPAPPTALDDPDVQLLMVIDRLEQLGSLAATVPRAQREQRASELEAVCLPLVATRAPGLAMELWVQLEDIRADARPGSDTMERF